MTKEQQMEFDKLQKKCKEDEEVRVVARTSRPGELTFVISKSNKK